MFKLTCRAALFLFFLQVLGQTAGAGTVTGTVTLATGPVPAGATANIRNAAAGFHATQPTGDSGQFDFNNPPRR